jgi:cytochrome c oxidase subunit 4
MLEMKEKETKWLNRILLAMAGLSLVVAAWTLYNYELRAGTDDLFLVMVCLLMALLFAASPALEFARKYAVADEAEITEESIHEEKAERRQTVLVWGGLLFLTAVEVFLAYIHLKPLLMLTVLMLLSIMKAGLIIAYFMHMKFERMSFVLTVVPTLVVLLCLFSIFFPDSFRLNTMKPPQSVEKVERPGGERH